MTTFYRTGTCCKYRRYRYCPVHELHGKKLTVQQGFGTATQKQSAESVKALDHVVQ